MRAAQFPDPGAAALLVVDMQRDCMEDGPLAVSGATTIIPVINHYVAQFANLGAAIYFSRNRHPPDHCSFRSQGGRWPTHCVADSDGAEFARGLQVPEESVIVSKGTEAAHEAQSAFAGTALAQLLHERQIRDLWVAGLTTEHSIRATVLDASASGFSVTLLVDAIRARDDIAGAADRALADMLAAGARVHSWARPPRRIIASHERSTGRSF
jgi:nicotinamidase/pyrazinamidase